MGLDRQPTKSGTKSLCAVTNLARQPRMNARVQRLCYDSVALVSMKKLHASFACFQILLALSFSPIAARAASVGPSGYTNAFSVQPPVADWSYFSIAGTAGTITTAPDLDTAVQAVPASSI